MLEIRNNFICIFCGQKHSEGMRFRKGCGICAECDGKISRTPSVGSFAGRYHVKYIISPLFYEGFVRDAVMRFKFEGWSGCADVFTYIMRRYISAFPHLRDFDMAVPVPLSKQRYNERGFNQSKPIAEAVAKEARIRCDLKSLIKIRHTKRQSKLTAKERFENVLGAYAAMPNANKKRIILVDDIYTTGATMEECARTLTEAGAKEVVGVALSIKYRKEKNLIIRY